MPLGLMGAGAGAADGLEQLLTQRRQDEMMQQQALEKAMSAIGLQQNQQARLAQTKTQNDALSAYRDSETKNRRAAIIGKQADSLQPGSNLSLSSFQKFTDPETGALDPSQFSGLPGGQGLKAGAISGLMPIDRSQAGADQSTPFDPSQAIAPGYTFKGTAQQQARTASQGSVDTEREARIQKLTDDAGRAWQALQMKGDNEASRLALAKAAADLSTVKAESARQRNEDLASKTPQPQFFRDEKGATHAVIFDRGQFKEVPLPAGFTPTKAEPPGFFDKLKGLFGGSSSDPTDPNWGKKQP